MTAARRSTLAPTLALVGVTAVWGLTFVTVKDAIERMPVTDFLTWRFGIATLAMALVRPRALASVGPRGRRVGAVAGLALGVGYLGQTLGLVTTSAAVSGFITGLFVVLTPLFGALLLRDRVPGSLWLSVVLATTGLGLLSLRGLSVGPGELLTLLCAACFALHILALGRWAPAYDAAGLAVVQLATVALLCLAVAAPGGVAVPPDLGVWGALLLTAVPATAVAFLVQTWAQAHLAPARAAVVMTMEPVFAGLFAVLVAGEVLGPRTLLGGTLVVLAMLVAELRGDRREEEDPLGRVERLET